MIKVIILDFDGVVIESENIKTEAFRKMFKDQPEISGPLMEYHCKNRSKSRFKKFEWLYKNILKKPLSEEKKKYLGDKFYKLVYKDIIACPFVKGALEFLDEFYGVLPIYIASINPQYELENIIEKRGLTNYFKGIFGTIGMKADLINKILKIESISPREAIFVGDMMADFIASQKTGVRFVACQDDNSFAGLNVIRFRNLNEIKYWLRNEIKARGTKGLAEVKNSGLEK